MGKIIVLFLVPLVFSSALYAQYSLPRILVLCLGMFIWSEHSKIKRTKVDWIILAGLFALFVRVIFSPDPVVSLLGRYNDFSLGFIEILLYVCCFYLGTSPKKEDLKWSVFAAALMGLYAVLQIYGIEPFMRPADLPGGRAVSTLGSPVHLGLFLAMNLCLALGMSWWLGPIVIAGIFASVSRGAILAVIFGLSVYFGVRFKRMALPGATIALLAVSGVFLASRDSMSDKARLAGWEVAGQEFIRNPKGTGLETFGLTFRKHKPESFIKSRGAFHRHEHAHNDVLHVLTTVGIVGVTAYLVLWGILGYNSTSPVLAACIASFFLFLKFNPGSPASYSLFAVVSGMILKTDKPLNLGPPMRTMLVPLILCFSFLNFTDYIYHSVRHKRNWKAIESLEFANRLSPWEPEYARTLLNVYIEAGRKGFMPWKEVILKSTQVSDSLLSWRPNLSDAFYQSAYISLVGSQLGMPLWKKANRHINKALELDPSFPPLKNLEIEIKRGLK